MPCCAVYSCRNYNKLTKGSSIKYYRFPKDEGFQAIWMTACKRQDPINIKNACICSKHFEKSCFEISLKRQMLQYSGKSWRDLKADAIPTLHLPEDKKRRDMEDSPSMQENKGQEADSSQQPDISTTNCTFAFVEIPSSVKLEIIDDTNEKDYSQHLGCSTTKCTIPSTEEYSSVKVEVADANEIDYGQEPDCSLTKCTSPFSKTPTTEEYSNVKVEVVDTNGREIFKLKERIKELESENLSLRKKLEEKNRSEDHLMQNLEKLFTDDQIRRLLKPNFVAEREPKSIL